MLIYGPVHLLPLFIFNSQRLWQTPGEALGRVGEAAVRSSAFLASFIAVVWGTITSVRAVLGDDTVVGPALGSSLCGLSLLLEKKSRRKELAMYVLPRAVETVIWQSPLLTRLWPRVEPGVFCAACAAIMWHFEHSPEDIRPSIASLMRWGLGRSE